MIVRNLSLHQQKQYAQDIRTCLERYITESNLPVSVDAMWEALAQNANNGIVRITVNEQGQILKEENLSKSHVFFIANHDYRFIGFGLFSISNDGAGNVLTISALYIEKGQEFGWDEAVMEFRQAAQATGCRGIIYQERTLKTELVEVLQPFGLVIDHVTYSLPVAAGRVTPSKEDNGNGSGDSKIMPIRKKEKVK